MHYYITTRALIAIATILFSFHCIMSLDSANFDFQHYVFNWRKKRHTHKFVYILIMVVSKNLVILLVMN